MKDGSADRLVSYEVWTWCDLINKLTALEVLDIDYVVVRNRDADGKLGWDVRVASGTQQTISDDRVQYVTTAATGSADRAGREGEAK